MDNETRLERIARDIPDSEVQDDAAITTVKRDIAKHDKAHREATAEYKLRSELVDRCDAEKAAASAEFERLSGCRRSVACGILRAQTGPSEDEEVCAAIEREQRRIERAELARPVFEAEAQAGYRAVESAAREHSESNMKLRKLRDARKLEIARTRL